LTNAGLGADPRLQVDASDSTEFLGYSAITELLGRGVGFDAVFAASDLMAIGAMRALAERGLSVPGDVAVIGFDDIPMASFAIPPLTTVAQDTKRAGEVLVESVIAQIRGEPARSVMLPTTLVIRRSSGVERISAASRRAVR
jgi:DNA-binding LacI/PurR family transcriptional regulator